MILYVQRRLWSAHNEKYQEHQSGLTERALNGLHTVLCVASCPSGQTWPISWPVGICGFISLAGDAGWTHVWNVLSSLNHNLCIMAVWMYVVRLSHDTRLYPRTQSVRLLLGSYLVLYSLITVTQFQALWFRRTSHCCCYLAAVYKPELNMWAKPGCRTLWALCRQEDTLRPSAWTLLAGSLPCNSCGPRSTCTAEQKISLNGHSQHVHSKFVY